MKQFDNLNYYELFEIPPNATHNEIQIAYELAKKTYNSDSIATYSLFDTDSRQHILDRIEEAFSVLSDDNKRNQYQMKLGFTTQFPLHPTSQLVESNPKEISPEEAPSSSERLSTSVEIPVKKKADLLRQEINGKFLQERREQRGIPLQEIANKTRISISYLQFIEKDRFDGLPAIVYLHGYLTQYVKMLSLDPEIVVQRYLMRYEAWIKSKN